MLPEQLARGVSRKSLILRGYCQRGRLDGKKLLRRTLRGTVEASFRVRYVTTSGRAHGQERRNRGTIVLGSGWLAARSANGFPGHACAGEPALRRVVEDLLDSNDRLSGFLSEPAYAQAGDGVRASQTVVLAAGVRLDGVRKNRKVGRL